MSSRYVRSPSEKKKMSSSPFAQKNAGYLKQKQHALDRKSFFETMAC